MQSEGTGTGRAPDDLEQLAAALSAANVRIAELESELEGKQAALSRLLGEDLRTCEELAELQKMIWGYHRTLPGGCDCDVCKEVERSHAELEGHD